MLVYQCTICKMYTTTLELFVGMSEPRAEMEGWLLYNKIGDHRNTSNNVLMVITTLLIESMVTTVILEIMLTKLTKL